MYASTAEQQRRTKVQALAEQLYRERYDSLLRIAVRHAANREDAEDAVQFSLFALIDKYDPAPRPWPGSHFMPTSALCRPRHNTLVLQRRCWALRREAHLYRRASQEAAPNSAGRSFAAESIPCGDAGPSSWSSSSTTPAYASPP